MDLEETPAAEPEDGDREDPVLQQVGGFISPHILLSLFKVFLPTEQIIPVSKRDLSPFRVLFPR
jgi:hypothetical protein